MLCCGSAELNSRCAVCCVGGFRHTVKLRDQVCEVQRAHHGEVAWVLLSQETRLLVLRCLVLAYVRLQSLHYSSAMRVNILLSVGTGASSLGLLGPFLRVAMMSVYTLVCGVEEGGEVWERICFCVCCRGKMVKLPRVRWTGQAYGTILFGRESQNVIRPLGWPSRNFTRPVIRHD